jgi:hypothetical protein
MTPLLANVGIPMIAIQMWWMILAFIPIVLVESIIIKRRLDMRFSRILLDVGLANAVSTLMGVPLAWLFTFILEIVTTSGGTAFGLDSPLKKLIAVTLQAAWLVPYKGQHYWMVPAASTALLIPSFLLSVPMERLVLKLRWDDQNPATVAAVVLRANVVSYLLLFLIGSIYTLFKLQ